MKPRAPRDGKNPEWAADGRGGAKILLGFTAAWRGA
jgi:hypothetical protein